MRPVSHAKYLRSVAKRDAAEKVIHEYQRQQAESFKVRWEAFGKGKRFFEKGDLIFAATQRCAACGAGLAYPKGCGPDHQWTCSAVLMGTFDRAVDNHGAFPFSMYEIKSEEQPSAHGATTRPD